MVCLYIGLFRLYLAGLTFIAYCRYHSFESCGVLAGTLIYVFSFYFIMVSVLHPFFLNPLINLPFLLLGIDKILDGKSPISFILSVFLAAAPFLYEGAYYFKWIIAFVNSNADYYAAMGYTVVGMLAVILLFAKTGWREKAIYKIAFIMSSFGLCIPFVGHILNEFGYVTNRWVWAYCFIISVITVKMAPQIINLRSTTLFLVSIAEIGFAIPIFCYSVTNQSVTQYLYDSEMNIYTDYVYTDMDSRVYVDAALGVRYFVVPDSDNMSQY